MRRWTAPPHRLATDLLGLAVFVLVVAVVAVVGSLGTTAATGDRYADLQRPPWAPPAWLFAPVWTVLYVTVAVAGWLVWRRVGLARELVPYGVQLVLNAAWTPLFFGAAAYTAAAVEIVALWLAVAATVLTFRRVHVGAAWLLVPYWLWTTYATALTVAIVILN